MNRMMGSQPQGWLFFAWWRTMHDNILLKEGFSCLIPAAIADYEVIPMQSRTRLLETYIDNMDRSLIHKVSRFLHISEK